LKTKYGIENEKIIANNKTLSKVSSESKSKFAIVLYNFEGNIDNDELVVKKNDIIKVFDWDIKDGWVYGCNKNQPEESGYVPKPLIAEYNEEKTGNIGCYYR